MVYPSGGGRRLVRDAVANQIRGFGGGRSADDERRTCARLLSGPTAPKGRFCCAGLVGVVGEQPTFFGSSSSKSGPLLPAFCFLGGFHGRNAEAHHRGQGACDR